LALYIARGYLPAAAWSLLRLEAESSTYNLQLNILDYNSTSTPYKEQIFYNEIWLPSTTLFPKLNPPLAPKFIHRTMEAHTFTSPAWEQYLETRKHLDPEVREKLDYELEIYYRDVQARAYGETTTLQQEQDTIHFASQITTLQTSQPKPKEQVGFLDLPGEMRNDIYRYVYLRSEPLNGIDDKIPGIWLLATSKQIHEEASSIFYGENTFLFGLDINWDVNAEIVLAGFPRHLPIWPTPAYFPHLKKLHIKFNFRSGDPTAFEGPEMHCRGIQAMRKAYDDIWDELGKCTYSLIAAF
jgi:hypothetical protein